MILLNIENRTNSFRDTYLNARISFFNVANAVSKQNVEIFLRISMFNSKNGQTWVTKNYDCLKIEHFIKIFTKLLFHFLCKNKKWSIFFYLLDFYWWITIFSKKSLLSYGFLPFQKFSKRMEFNVIFLWIQIISCLCGLNKLSKLYFHWKNLWNQF